MIFFSVIIPTYNRSSLISETIDSVLIQTYPHFEIIIVDDGSTDDTGKLIKEKYGHDPRIKYYYKENEERGVARNYGMQKAKGDYAVIFDSDDWMHSDHLTVLENSISRGADRPVNFIATKYQLKDDHGNIIPGASSGLSPGWYGLDEILRGNYFGCLFAFNLRNEKLFFFPPERKYSTLEDWLFLLENLQQDKLLLIDKVTITVRHHDNRSMFSNQRVIRARKDVVEWGLEHLHLNKRQRNVFIAWSHYFCGVHEYLDYKKAASVKEAFLAIRKLGLRKKFILLFAKSFVGKKIIKRIRGQR